MNASIFVGIGFLAFSTLLAWRINRGKKTSLAKRWPQTFFATLMGSFFGGLSIIFSLGLSLETASIVGDIFTLVWTLYLLTGLAGCFVAFTHAGRVERKAFRDSLAQGLPALLPMISARRLAIWAAVIGFMAMFVVVVAVAGATGTDTSAEDGLVEIIMIGTFLTGLAGAAAWWIQRRRVTRRDEDYHKAQESQLQRRAQENSVAYRNGFDDGQTAAR